MKAVIIMTSAEWVAQQTWDTEVSIAHHKIKEAYQYNCMHEPTSIKDILEILVATDKSED